MRYVVLHHRAWPGRSDHYDLLLQVAAGADDDARVLKAFATLDDRFPTAARLRQQRDHRRRYLHYEGPVTGGRGRVERVDEGSVRFLGAPERLAFRLAGARLRGTFRLRALGGGLYALERAARSRSRLT
jgi:hypothetical protein